MTNRALVFELFHLFENGFVLGKNWYKYLSTYWSQWSQLLFLTFKPYVSKSGKENWLFSTCFTTSITGAFVMLQLTYIQHLTFYCTEVDQKSLPWCSLKQELQSKCCLLYAIFSWTILKVDMADFITFSKMVNHARMAILTTTNLLSDDNKRGTQTSN